MLWFWERHRSFHWSVVLICISQLLALSSKLALSLLCLRWNNCFFAVTWCSMHEFVDAMLLSIKRELLSAFEMTVDLTFCIQVVFFFAESMNCSVVGKWPTCVRLLLRLWCQLFSLQPSILLRAVTAYVFSASSLIWGRQLLVYDLWF